MRGSSSSSSRSGRSAQAVQLRGPSTTAQTFLTALPGSAEELQAKARLLFHLPPHAPLRLTLADERIEICEDALPFLRDREVVVVHADLASAVSPVSAPALEADGMTRTPPTNRARSLLDPLPRTGTTPTPSRSRYSNPAWPAPPAERGPVATEAPGSIRYGQAGGRKRHVANTLERIAQQTAAEKAERTVLRAYAQAPDEQPPQSQEASLQDLQPSPPQDTSPNTTDDPPVVSPSAHDKGSSPDPLPNTPSLGLSADKEAPSIAAKVAESVQDAAVDTPVSPHAADRTQGPCSAEEPAFTASVGNETNIPKDDVALAAQAASRPSRTETENPTSTRPPMSTHPAPEEVEPLSSPPKDSQNIVASGEATGSIASSPLRRLQEPDSPGDAQSPSPQKRKIPPGKLLQATLLPGKRPRTEGPKNLIKAVVGPLRAHPCTTALATKDTALWGEGYAAYLAQVRAEDDVVDLPSLMRWVEGGELSAKSGSSPGSTPSSRLAELHAVLQRLFSLQEAFHLTGGRVDEAGRCRTLAHFVQMLITEHTPRAAAPAVRLTHNNNPKPTPTPIRLPRRSLPPAGQTPPSAKSANGELAFLSLMHQVHRDRATADS